MKRVHRRKPNIQKDDVQKPFFNDKSDETAFFRSKKKKKGPGLVMGKPGDKYEQQADQMASAVVDSPGTGMVSRKELASVEQAKLGNMAKEEEMAAQAMEEEEAAQTMEEEEPAQTMEEEEAAQTMEEEEAAQTVEEEEAAQAMEEEETAQTMEEEEAAQAKTNDSASPVKGEGVSEQIKRRRGKGRQMDKKTQNEMESAFGVDFSDVNIHTDADAVDMSKSLHAQAFTNGKDIYFNAGKYNPQNNDGKRLLAHELTHTIQQGPGIQKKEEQTATPASQVSGNPLTGLKKGDGLVFGTFHLRPRVSLLQQKLNEKTFSGLQVDGMFGPKTMGALRLFRSFYMGNTIQQVSVDDAGLELGATQSAPSLEEVVDPLTADALFSPLSDEHCKDTKKGPFDFSFGAVKFDTIVDNELCTETGKIVVRGSFKWRVNWDKVKGDDPVDFNFFVEAFDTEDLVNPKDKKLMRAEDEETPIKVELEVPKLKNYLVRFRVPKPQHAKRLSGKGIIHEK